jgi:hypothetical protein
MRLALKLLVEIQLVVGFFSRGTRESRFLKAGL